MIIRIVIDTNIWISALLNPYGFPAKLRKAFEKSLFEVVISAPILKENAGCDKDLIAAKQLRKLLDLENEK